MSKPEKEQLERPQRFRVRFEDGQIGIAFTRSSDGHIVVDRASGQAATSGLLQGDILVGINEHMLPPGVDRNSIRDLIKAVGRPFDMVFERGMAGPDASGPEVGGDQRSEGEDNEWVGEHAYNDDDEPSAFQGSIHFVPQEAPFAIDSSLYWGVRGKRAMSEVFEYLVHLLTPWSFP